MTILLTKIMYSKQQGQMIAFKLPLYIDGLRTTI